MNTKKIILLSGIGFLVLILLWVVLNLNSDKTTDGGTSGISQYTVWTYNDNVSGMQNVLAQFAETNSEYKDTTFIVENFNDYEEYTLALQSAFSQGIGPDLYEINNSEKNGILTYQSQGLDPSIFSPNDFRKRYGTVFGEDLIDVIELPGENPEELESVEYIKGLPVGYETLGVYYNKAKRITSADFQSIGTMNGLINQLKDRLPTTIPLALGNGSTVLYAPEIIKQFLLLESDVSSLANLTSGKLKSGLTSYKIYGDTNSDNGYNARFSDTSALGKTSLDLFVNGDVHMMVGFPRLVEEIDKQGFRSAFLEVSPFPFHNQATGFSSVNYDFFVKNKDSLNGELSNSLISYLASDIGVNNYLQNYSYYLPALLSLESDALGEKILNNYNVVLGDFYNPNHLLKTFDIGVKSIFDREVIDVLDNNSTYISLFEELQSTLVCQSNKYTSLSDLSRSCK